jgi:hypothetical protein
MSDLVQRDEVRPEVNAWDAPLGDPNIQDARIAHTLAPLAGVPVVGRVEAMYRQKFRLKSWQYMTAVTDELFIAFVVGTAGFASNGFVYAAELANGRVHKKFAITPLTLGTVLAPSSTQGLHRFQTRGLSVVIENHGRAFDARVEAKTDTGKLTANLAFASRKNDDHLAICVPLPGKRWNYTHKFAAFDVSGEVTLDDRRINFAAGSSFGTMDFTKMYALRHAVWRWIALCGRTKQGRVVGLNLVDPTPDAPISENALWVDGKRQALSNVRIGTDEAHADGVSIKLREVAQVEQKLDIPLVRHRLRHVIGSFSGSVTTQTGEKLDVNDVVGIYEDYDTWW